MPKLPELPVDVTNGEGTKRTASTPTEFWDLFARGYKVSPQAKAAATRRANAKKDKTDQQEEQETSHDGPDTTDAGTNQT
jgi:hypothetical protein